jgi:hypothetical protein
VHLMLFFLNQKLLQPGYRVPNKYTCTYSKSVKVCKGEHDRASSMYCSCVAVASSALAGWLDMDTYMDWMLGWLAAGLFDQHLALPHWRHTVVWFSLIYIVWMSENQKSEMQFYKIYFMFSHIVCTHSDTNIQDAQQGCV